MAAALRRLKDTERAERIEAALGLCRTWMVVGPFDAAKADAVVGPEADPGRVDLTDKYPLGSDGNVGWIAPTDPILPRTWQNRGVYFALAHVTVDKACEAQLRLAADGQAIAWLNGKEVMRAPAIDYPVIDQNVAPVELRAGRNELLIKITQAGGGWGGAARFLDTQRKPITTLRTEPGLAPESRANSAR